MSVTEPSTSTTQACETIFPSLRTHLCKKFHGRVKQLHLDYNGVFDFVELGVVAFGGPPNKELLESIAAAIDTWVKQSDQLGLPVLGIKGHVRLDDKVAHNDTGLSGVAITELKTVAASIENAILTSGQACPSELYLSIGCRDGKPIGLPMNPTVDFTRVVPAPIAKIEAWARRHTGWLTSGENLGVLYRFPTAAVDSLSPTIH